jgi:hypothetical protein
MRDAAVAAGYLGRAILRLAVAEALRLIKEQGLAPDDAARRATPGAWAEYRAKVSTMLAEWRRDE